MLNVLHSRLLSHAHLFGIGARGHPLGRLARGRLLEHAVDLLESKTLGLRDEEVGVDEADGAETTPKVEDLGAEVGPVLVDQVRGDESTRLGRKR